MQLNMFRKFAFLVTLCLASSGLVLGGAVPAQATGSEMLLTYHVVAGARVELPLESHTGVTIDWGDGYIQGPLPTNAFWPVHTYQTTQIVQIKLSGTITIYGPESLGMEYLRSVDSFGAVGLNVLSGAFSGATNLVSLPAELPNTVTKLDGLLQGASVFNQDLSSWDVSRVTDMTGMFYHATAFNQDLSGWDTSHVELMNDMFNGASSFDQDISDWGIDNLLAADGMFNNSGLSAQNYSALLNGWATQNIQQNVILGATDVHYYPSAETSRSLLINQKFWNITDSGAIPEPAYVVTAPRATSVVEGQALSSSILSGGTASVAGTFSFVDPTQILNVGIHSVEVKFTPTDTSLTPPASFNISVQVNTSPELGSKSGQLANTGNQSKEIMTVGIAFLLWGWLVLVRHNRQTR